MRKPIPFLAELQAVDASNIKFNIARVARQ
jgi:hypothetical protein